MSEQAVIVGALRTPMGRSKDGIFRLKRAEELSVDLIRALLSQYPQVETDSLDDVIWGCVQQTKEQGFNLARLISLQVPIPESVPAQTVNRLCGSSMTAVHLAAQSIMAGQGHTYLCGGVEHMGHVPMNEGLDFSPKGSLFYAKNAQSMGLTAELLAKKHGVTRKEQDEFAFRSHKLALDAEKKGRFQKEKISVQGHDPQGVPHFFEEDEVVRKDISLESLGQLPSVFDPQGSVTPGNASALSDGAAALIVMSQSRARHLGLEPLAKIRSLATVGVSPSLMGYGPVPASRKALALAGISVEDLDVVEINEAFAAQVLPVVKDLGLQSSMEAKVNIHGGAIALGHPLGASGARILGTVAHSLHIGQLRLGLATMCIGFGQGVATVLEGV